MENANYHFGGTTKHAQWHRWHKKKNTISELTEWQNDPVAHGTIEPIFFDDIFNEAISIVINKSKYYTRLVEFALNDGQQRNSKRKLFRFIEKNASCEQTHALRPRRWNIFGFLSEFSFSLFCASQSRKTIIILCCLPICVVPCVYVCMCGGGACVCMCVSDVLARETCGSKTILGVDHDFRRTLFFLCFRDGPWSLSHGRNWSGLHIRCTRL